MMIPGSDSVNNRNMIDPTEMEMPPPDKAAYTYVNTHLVLLSHDYPHSGNLAPCLK
jgi:hypothetical protein